MQLMTAYPEAATRDQRGEGRFRALFYRCRIACREPTPTYFCEIARESTIRVSRIIGALIYRDDRHRWLKFLGCVKLDVKTCFFSNL